MVYASVTWLSYHAAGIEAQRIHENAGTLTITIVVMPVFCQHALNEADQPVSKQAGEALGPSLF